MIISMKNYNESFSEKLLMKRVTQKKCLWSTNIQRYWVQIFFVFWNWRISRRTACFAPTMPECRLFSGLTTRERGSLFAGKIRALGSSASDACRAKNVKTNRLLREVTGRPSGISPACRMWPTRPTRGRDVSLKRRWNLNVYLKYIQKEVTVSLSCAGFYNSPFSISHVRKMFLPLVTAQCTTVVFFFNVLFRYTDANES